MKDKIQKFEETVATLEPKARELVDALFEKYSLPLPNISSHNDSDTEFSLSWGYSDDKGYSDYIFLEFSWDIEYGYSWFGYIGDKNYGSERSSHSPVPPEADEFIRKVFPQTPEELNGSIFDKEVLARVVQYYSR